MSKTEAELDFLESQIPALAEAATRTAFWNALTRGQSVLVAEGDDLIEISPDGSRRFVKKLAPNVPAPIDAKL